MNDLPLPDDIKKSFTNLEEIMQTGSLSKIISNFEIILENIIQTQNISCDTNCHIEISPSPSEYSQKIRVNLIIPNQNTPNILILIKFIPDFPDILTNYMIEALMLKEKFGDDIKLIYIFHDSNRNIIDGPDYQALIKEMKEKNYIEALLFLPKDIKKFIELIRY